MIRYFAAHPTAANLLMLLLIVMGLLALPALQRETMPDFTPLEVEARVPYPGASTLEVEEAICRRLEDAVDGIEDRKEIRCEAREGMGTLVAEMREGADFIRFLDDVKTEVEAIDDFPEQAERPIIRQIGRFDPVVSIALTGPMAVTDLKTYAEQFKDRLQRLDVASQVAIEGFAERQLRVEVPVLSLRQYGLSITAIADAIARQSIDLPVGDIETQEQEILIRFADQRRSTQELEELIVVGSPNGAELRLGDIATISERFELDEEKIVFNGQRAAILNITKTRAQDTLTVMDAVKAFVEEERERAPQGVSFTLTRDVASIVRDRLQMLLRNGTQGLLLVFVTMWLFFQLRFAFWVAVGLPTSFLGALFFIAMLGYSINMITMVALLIAIGLLMDDAIVIAENIASHLQRGTSALQAAIEGTQQVAPGVLSSFLTTTAVFGPLAFLEGNIGQVLRVMPVVLLLVLAVSLIEAFMILPHHLAHALRHAPPWPSRFRQGFDHQLEQIRDRGLGRIVDWVIHWRYLFMGLVVAVFLVSVGMIAGGHLQFRAFPEIDGDVIEARILLPQGTPLRRTETVAAKVIAALERVNAEFTPRQPGERSLVKNTSVQFNRNLDAHEVGPHVATVTADLLTAEQRVGLLDDILGRWREETGNLPDVLNISFTEPQIGPAGLPIEIRLSGPDLADLMAASLELQQWLGNYVGVFDLLDDLRPGKPELRLHLREGALALGLDAATIARQLRAAFFGITAQEIQIGLEGYAIDVRLSQADRASVTELEEFRITTPAGRQVPLVAVAVLEADRGYARIHRIDARRTVTVQGDVDPRLANANAIINDTRERLLPELQERYPTVSVTLEGQVREAQATGASLAQGFVVGLIGIFILLSFQFRSYIEPVVVMSAIPLTLIGVVWGHLLMGLDLSMPSMMGLVSLAGIVVNDSILLVLFLKLRAGEGLGVLDAARAASRERFRAVLLTSLTTIAGLLPLLMERSLQAQVLIPLVASIVFGLLVTTALVLLIVPALYSILNDWGLTSLAKGHSRTSAQPLVNENE